MKDRWPVVLAVAAALAVAALYVVKTLEVGPRLAFPLDDAYTYLTYAKQAGRGHPFTYFDGGGYSSGATSALWPLLIAPLWTLGLRGHLFVWAVYSVCTVLLAVTAGLAVELGRRVTGNAAVGLVGAALIVASGATTWGYLSGMEVALCGTCLLASGLRLLREGKARPSVWLLVLLAATALARPEASVLVGALCGLRALAATARRDLATAARWLAPLAPTVLLMLANRLFTGHFSPNTAHVKAHMYLPGFDWAAWPATVLAETRVFLDATFWSGLDGKEPLWAPRLMLVAYLVGVARLLHWGWREGKLAGAAFLAFAPVALFAVVMVLTSGWQFHNYRYIAGGLPALLAVAGLAVAPPRRIPAPLATALALLLAGGVVWGSRTLLRRDIYIFAQGANDLSVQMVRAADYVRTELPPDATIAVHDVGILGYFGERRMIDVIGLITNGTAEHCNNGPGARFEFFERLPPAERPTHFVYYPGWLLTGSQDLFGKKLLASGAPAPVLGAKRLLGGSTMTVMEVRWDLLGSGELPRTAGDWKVVDAVDVADLVDERAHGYVADLGRRSIRSLSASWSQYLAPEIDGAQVADGGRTIHPGGERMTLSVDPARPLRLVVRSGGPTTMAGSKIPDLPATLIVRDAAGRELGRLVLPQPAPTFAETTLELPADPARPGKLALSVSSADRKPYRVFHYWALQP